MGLERIEELTRTFADSRQRLADMVTELQDEIEALKRQRLPGIKKTAAEMAVDHDSLHAEIKEHKDLFNKPRTRIIAGIRVGIKKEKGKLVIEDEEATIKLIKRRLPDLADNLIKTIEKVIKAALDGLSATDLKKIGVTAKDATDSVYIKPIGDDIDKFVGALLEEYASLLEEAA